MSVFRSREREKERAKKDRPEGKSGEGPVALVAVGVVHGYTPKVVLEQAHERVWSDDVLVPDDGRYVVVHKVAAERVEVGPDGDESHGEVNAPAGRLLVRPVAEAPTRAAGARAGARAGLTLLLVTATAGRVQVVVVSPLHLAVQPPLGYLEALRMLAHSATSKLDHGTFVLLTLSAVATTRQRRVLSHDSPTLYSTFAKDDAGGGGRQKFNTTRGCFNLPPAAAW